MLTHLGTVVATAGRRWSDTIVYPPLRENALAIPYAVLCKARGELERESESEVGPIAKDVRSKKKVLREK